MVAFLREHDSERWNIDTLGTLPLTAGMERCALVP